jgi:hypothetical protein
MRKSFWPIAGLMAIFSLSACAAPPKYKYRIVKLVESPSMPLDQAKEVCSARADLAAQQAASNAPAASPPNSNSKYNCTSRRNAAGTINTECNQAPSNNVFLDALADEQAAQSARASARAAGMATARACMAELGWKIQRKCVENCN